MIYIFCYFVCYSGAKGDDGTPETGMSQRFVAVIGFGVFI